MSRCNITSVQHPTGITSDCVSDCPGQTDRSASGGSGTATACVRDEMSWTGVETEGRRRARLDRPYYYTDPSSFSVVGRAGGESHPPGPGQGTKSDSRLTARCWVCQWIDQSGRPDKYMRYRAASWSSPMGRGVQAREIWVVMRRPELGNETADADQSVQWERMCGLSAGLRVDVVVDLRRVRIASGVSRTAF